MPRCDVISSPHIRRSTNRRSMPSLNSIAVGTDGRMFWDVIFPCQSRSCRSLSGLFWVFFVTVKPTILVPSWLVCHLPRISKNGTNLPLFWSCKGKNAFSVREGGFTSWLSYKIPGFAPVPYDTSLRHEVYLKPVVFGIRIRWDLLKDVFDILSTNLGAKQLSNSSAEFLESHVLCKHRRCQTYIQDELIKTSPVTKESG